MFFLHVSVPLLMYYKMDGFINVDGISRYLEIDIRVMLLVPNMCLQLDIFSKYQNGESNNKNLQSLNVKNIKVRSLTFS